MKTSTNPPSAPSPNGANGESKSSGRDANGRFAAGNVGGPGNPFARRTAEYRKAIAEAVTPEDFRDIALALIIKAKAGHTEATKLVFQYLLGKPRPTVDPDRLDIDEWNLFKRTSATSIAGCASSSEPVGNESRPFRRRPAPRRSGYTRS